MDTKSKNSKTRIIIKAVCVLLSIVCIFFSACFTILTAQRIHIGGKYDITAIDSLDYTETGYLNERFMRAVTYAQGITRVLGNSKAQAKFTAEKDKNVQAVLDEYLERQASIITEELKSAVREYDYDDEYYNYSEENIKTAKKALTSAAGKDILKYKYLVRDEAFDESFDILIDGLGSEEGYYLDYLGYDENVAKQKISEYYDKLVDALSRENYGWMAGGLKDLEEFDYYISCKDSKKVITDIEKPEEFLKAVSGGAKAYFDNPDAKNAPYVKFIAVTENGIESEGVESLTGNDYFYNYDPVNNPLDKSSWADGATVYIYFNGTTSAIQNFWEHSSFPTLQAAIIALVFLAAAVILLIAGAVLTGHTNEDGKTVLHPNDKIPTDISLLLALFFFVCFAGGAIGFAAAFLFGGDISSFDAVGLLCDKTALAAAGAFSALAFGVFECWLYSVIRIKKSGASWFGKFIIFRPLVWFFGKIRKLLSLLTYKPKQLGRNVMIFCTVALITDLFLLCGIVNFAENEPGASVFFGIIFAAFNAYVLTKVLGYFRKLDTVIQAAHDGNFNIDSTGYPSSLRNLCDSMQVTGDRLEKAVDAAVRDERMRAELITNVSHDLKTPLTSIINYTDLLSRCDIEDETAKGYIEVLSERSGRLKVLIEDLVEASKASSGAITLNIETLDLTELAKQTAGEMQENFDKAQLEIKQTFPDSPVMIKADGLRTCRILENLMGNAAKYSAAGSRVYITVSEDGTNGVFEIKNISKNELNISADELTERFVRGDASRTDGGNGLGLSIARDLATLQGGSLDIEIDGDLFKATVKLPLA